MDAIATVRAVLACDLACDEQDLLADGVRVVLAADRPGRRRFPRTDRVLMIATLGAGTVVSCDSSRLEWAHAQLAPLDRDELFTTATAARISARLEGEGQTLAGPDLKFVCAPGEMCDAAPPPDVQVEVVDGPAITPVYQHRGFRHALGYTSDSMRPDIVAAIATIGGRVVGIAGASADCDLMWQIGVDVVEDQRKRGVGRAIVSRLTKEVHARGRLPYYSAVVSNLKSSRLALAVGYRLAWVELYARSP